MPAAEPRLEDKIAATAPTLAVRPVRAATQTKAAKAGRTVETPAFCPFTTGSFRLAEAKPAKNGQTYAATPVPISEGGRLVFVEGARANNAVSGINSAHGSQTHFYLLGFSGEFSQTVNLIANNIGL